MLMFEKNQIAIVIPVYKEQLSSSEQISLQQALKVLKGYDFYFICPTSLKYEYKDIKKICFDDVWFESHRKYSELMLQDTLYQKFIKYEYILIYQLDAFVFNDQLPDFCKKGYDYIGAPWIHGIEFYKDVKNIIHYVGNGGLSLRRVDSFLQWLDSTDLTEWIEEVNEDILISAFGEPVLKIPPVEEALTFAFDLDPRECFKRNNYKLPFGCHAWRKIDLEFWRMHIERFGYSLEDIYDDGSYESYNLRYQRDDATRERLYKLSNEESIKAQMDKFTENGQKKLYIWGTGRWGTRVGRIFSELGIQIAGFIDNREKYAEDYLGYPLYVGRDFLENNITEAFIFIAVLQSEEIEQQLKRQQRNLNYITFEDIK